MLMADRRVPVAPGGKMKRLKLIGVILTVLMLLVTLAGCGADKKTADEDAISTVEVVRGDIMVDITAAGNLALSLIEDIVFEISGTTQEPPTAPTLASAR